MIETAVIAGLTTAATLLTQKVIAKLGKKDCGDCSLTVTVGLLKEAVILLVNYDERIPQAEKDKLAVRLVNQKGGR